MSQKDLVTFLTSVITQVSSIATAVNANRTEMNTMSLGYCGLASNTAAVQTTVTCPYKIYNIAYQKAAATGIALTGSALSSGTQALYLISLDSAGNATCTAGTAVANTATPVLPAVPSGYCPIAYLKLVNANGTFTPGTTNLGQTGQTVTFYNLSGMPSGTSATSALTNSLSLSGL
jgi:hypothetical protein